MLFAALMGANDAPPSPPSPLLQPGISKHQTTGDDAKAEEIWQRRLSAAFRISLNHSEVVRPIVCSASVQILCEADGQAPILTTVAAGLADDTDDTWYGTTPLIIGRLHADADPLRSNGEVIAHLRSVEHQYWSLLEAHARHWASNRALEAAEEVLKSEESDLTPTRGGNRADIAEIQERIKQLRLDFVAKTSDLVATERRLRNLMGLPASDGRRIIPVTPHVKEQRTFPQQVLDQATPSMTRWFLDVDASFKQLQEATRDSEASLKRLEAQRKFYDEGRILPDRYLDAVSQYASAVVREHRFKTSYNVALASLDAARGTYLSSRKVFVAVTPTTVDSDAQVGGAEPSANASGGALRAN